MPELNNLLQGLIPLLQVGDMSDTLTYYREALGFQLDFTWPDAESPKWARVSRDGVSLMFTVDLGTSSSLFIAEKGNGVVFYLIVADVEVAYEELAARGAIIVQDIHDFGERKQFSVADNNGYVLAISEAFAP